MSSASTDSSTCGKTVIELVTDSPLVPDGLKTAFQEAGVHLRAVHCPSGKDRPLQLQSDSARVLALVLDELPDSWLDTLLEQNEDRVLFLDWDGQCTQDVVQAVQHKLLSAEPPEERAGPGQATEKNPSPPAAFQASMPVTWLLAASIGGPEALRTFLARLPGDLPACLILVQHIGCEFQDQLVRQLNQASALPVTLMQDGDQHRPGHVFVVPSDKQVRLNEEDRFRLKPAKQRFTPCIDQVVSGLLPRLGEAMGMIVFSGMSNDGVAGSHAVHVAGGPVWVQTPETCVVASMVEGTMNKTETGLAGSPEELADMLVSVYN